MSELKNISKQNLEVNCCKSALIQDTIEGHTHIFLFDYRDASIITLNFVVIGISMIIIRFLFGEKGKKKFSQMISYS